MLGHKDRDVMHNWSKKILVEETSNRAIHFHTNQYSKSYSFECFGVKKRIVFDIILYQYRSGVDPLLMIIHGS